MGIGKIIDMDVIADAGIYRGPSVNNLAQH
jgi:hypothetical protein